MKVPLADPWFEAEFIGHGNEKTRGFARPVPIEEAQGVFLYCPCGYGKADSVAHGLLIPFANPPGGVLLPEKIGPVSKDGKRHPRWTMSGKGIADLTLTPSVDVGSSDGPSCWHGHITRGVVT